MVRAPLLGTVPAAGSYLVVAGLAVIGWLVTYVAVRTLPRAHSLLELRETRWQP